jgi:regulator of sigma D
MSDEIKAHMTELENIVNERTKNKAIDKKLKERQQYLENQIDKYLEEKKHPGVKNRNIAIIKEEKETRIRPKKKDGEDNCLKFLYEQGVKNPQEVFKTLMNKIKGDTTKLKTVIKIKKINS